MVYRGPSSGPAKIPDTIDLRWGFNYASKDMRHEIHDQFRGEQDPATSHLASVEADIHDASFGRAGRLLPVVDTEGLGVLNSWAGDKITAEKVIKALTDQKVAEKVKHRKLIIPGLLPVFKAEIEDMSEWKEVLIGPETAREIPAFLNRVWK